MLQTELPPSPSDLARHLLRRESRGALATFTRSGELVGALVPFRLGGDGMPQVLLPPGDAAAARLLRDPRATLLVVDGEAGDPSRALRVTLAGLAAPAVEGSAWPEAPGCEVFRIAVDTMCVATPAEPPAWAPFVEGAPRGA